MSPVHSSSAFENPQQIHDDNDLEPLRGDPVFEGLFVTKPTPESTTTKTDSREGGREEETGQEDRREGGQAQVRAEEEAGEASQVEADPTV